MNIPDLLTISRIAILPILISVGLLPCQTGRIATALIFGIAALTDGLDGYLARRWKQTSALGKFLDPVADKLLVSTSLLLIVNNYDTIWLTIPAIVFINRDIAVISLRQRLAEMHLQANAKVSYLAKIKTSLLMIAVFLLLLSPPILIPTEISLLTITAMAGLLLLYVSLILSVWSMVQYLQHSRSILNN